VKAVAIAAILALAGICWFLLREPMTPTLPEIGPGAHKLDAAVER
jgi:hypothetical protein